MSRFALQSQFLSRLSEHLPQAMAEFLVHRRWFGGKARQIRAVQIRDIVPLDIETSHVLLVFVHVGYASGPGETYSVPLIQRANKTSDQSETPTLTLRVEGEQEPVVLHDALSNEPFLIFLLEAIANERSFPGTRGIVRAFSTSALPSLWQPSRQPLPPSLMKAEQSNSSVVYGKKLVLKLFRRLEEGINPDLEIGRFLTEKALFPNTPAVAGYLEYVSTEGRPHSLGILQAFVRNRGDAWQFTLAALAEYYRWAAHAGTETLEVPGGSLLSIAEVELSDQARNKIGAYMDSARLLGQRTAELHLALNSQPDGLDFSPEPFRLSDQEKFCDSALDLLSRTFDLFRQRLQALSPRIQNAAQLVLNSEDQIQNHFRSIPELKLSGMRSRIHGDYHLGQILVSGDDFVIIDFEGEPARPLSERRAKRSPLQDVAGMLRSFHYAAYAPLLAEPENDAKLQSLGPWARYWQRWVSAAFLKSYLTTSGAAPYIPGTRSETEVLLTAFMLDKAVYELGYELNNRPLWVAIPLEGVSDLLGLNEEAEN
jgi:maltose alpha-D-glucosyltransferase / alpha-amylase